MSTQTRELNSSFKTLQTLIKSRLTKTMMREIFSYKNSYLARDPEEREIYINDVSEGLDYLVNVGLFCTWKIESISTFGDFMLRLASKSNSHENKLKYTNIWTIIYKWQKDNKLLFYENDEKDDNNNNNNNITSDKIVSNFDLLSSREILSIIARSTKVLMERLSEDEN